MARLFKKKTLLKTPGKAKNKLVRIGLACTSLAACAWGYWFFVKSPSLLPAFIAYLALTGAHTGLLWRHTIKARTDLFYIAIVLAICLPVYGIIGMSLLFVSLKHLRVKKGGRFEVEGVFQPRKHKMFLRYPDRKRWQVEQDELDISSFRDVFRLGDIEMEEIVIDKLSKTLTRQSVAILKEVLLTSGSDTKILAATALTEIEGKIIGKIDDLRYLLKKDGEDLKTMLELARTYDLYCYLGVLDIASVKTYQERAIRLYERYLASYPKSPDIAMEYGRLLHNAEREKQAIEILTRAVELAPENASPRIWLAEVLFEAGNYERVTEVCDDILALESVPERSKEVAALWATDTETSDQAERSKTNVDSRS